MLTAIYAPCMWMSCITMLLPPLLQTCDKCNYNMLSEELSDTSSERNVFIPSLSSRIVTVTVLDPTMTSLEFPTVTTTVKASSASRITSPLMLRSKQTSWLRGVEDGMMNCSLVSGRKSLASIGRKKLAHSSRCYPT